MVCFNPSFFSTFGTAQPGELYQCPLVLTFWHYTLITTGSLDKEAFNGGIFFHETLWNCSQSHPWIWAHCYEDLAHYEIPQLKVWSWRMPCLVLGANISPLSVTAGWFIVQLASKTPAAAPANCIPTAVSLNSPPSSKRNHDFQGHHSFPTFSSPVLPSCHVHNHLESQSPHC